VPPPELDIFAARVGSVTAPAGCGKTQLIADSLGLHVGPKPVLVLTHTNAGVTALRSRLQRAGVASSAYRVSTIDGFAMRLIAKFPRRSGHEPRILELENPNVDYPAIRSAAVNLLRNGHVSDPLRATYARLLVDEYQDCNDAQHAIVAWAAQTLPTCVLGDPMQAIFGFRGNRLVDWTADVLPHFPAIGQLATPWRWRRAGTENFGNWLLQARTLLQAGQAIDLRGAPPEVVWARLTPGDELRQRLAAAGTRPAARDDRVLVVGDARNVQGRLQLTSQTPGATSVETVDLRDLVQFARRFALADGAALRQLAEFASSLMTGVGPATFLPRVETIRGGRARNAPTPAEAAAVTFVTVPTLPNAVSVLEALAAQHGARVYRPDVLHCCVSAMRTAAGGDGDFVSAAVQARERNRHLGRPLGRRAVGSTLLLKGLEADVAVILHPELMNAQHLYVALTRGAKQVVICSDTPVLQPALGN